MDEPVPIVQEEAPAAEVLVAGAEAPEWESWRVVHWSEVQARRQGRLPWPAGLPNVPGRTYTCVVRVYVDPRGVPVHGTAAPECPREVAGSAEAAVTTWRFYPTRDAGEPVGVQFDLRVIYRGK